MRLAIFRVAIGQYEFKTSKMFSNEGPPTYRLDLFILVYRTSLKVLKVLWCSGVNL